MNVKTIKLCRFVSRKLYICVIFVLEKTIDLIFRLHFKKIFFGARKMSSSKEKKKQEAAAMQKVRQIIGGPRLKRVIPREEDVFSKKLLTNCPDVFTSDEDEEDEEEKEYVVKRILARHAVKFISTLEKQGALLKQRRRGHS